MTRLLGVDIPSNKRVEVALRYIYGIGPKISLNIIKKANISPDIKAKDLTDEHVNLITNIIQNDYLIEGELKNIVAQNIKRLVAINSYRGSRHKRKLPARGQRTKTNARTCKGRKVTIGAIRDRTKRKLAAKK